MSPRRNWNILELLPGDALSGVVLIVCAAVAMGIANSALWAIVRTRMVSHPPTKAYVQRRTAEGMSKKDIFRCLKRFIAREVYKHLTSMNIPRLHLLQAT